MKFYDEDQMRELRNTLEGTILKWPNVSSKEMMGCLCYFRGKKFFTFLVTNGIVVTKLDKDDRTKLSKLPGSKPFTMSGRTSKAWVQVPIKESSDVKQVLPYVRKGYEAALE